jgi:hypothetical protein
MTRPGEIACNVHADLGAPVGIRLALMASPLRKLSPVFFALK